MPCLKTAVDIALSKVIFSWERNYGDGSIFLVLPYFINGFLSVLIMIEMVVVFLSCIREDIPSNLFVIENITETFFVKLRNKFT